MGNADEGLGRLGLAWANRGMAAFAKKSADELGLDFVGSLNRVPSNGHIFRFGGADDAIETELRAIAPITGLYASIPHMLLGIQGENGHCGMRWTDVRARRYIGVFQTIAAINGVTWPPPPAQV